SIRNPQSPARRSVEDAKAAAIRNGIVYWPIWPHLYTLAVVMIGWVFFRADTFESAVLFLKAMAGFNTAVPAALPVQWYLTPELWLALVAGAIGSTPWVPALAARLERDGGTIRATTSLASTVALGALLVAAIMQMAARTY